LATHYLTIGSKLEDNFDGREALRLEDEAHPLMMIRLHTNANQLK